MIMELIKMVHVLPKFLLSYAVPLHLRFHYPLKLSLNLGLGESVFHYSCYRFSLKLAPCQCLYSTNPA